MTTPLSVAQIREERRRREDRVRADAEERRREEARDRAEAEERNRILAQNSALSQAHIEREERRRKEASARARDEKRSQREAPRFCASEEGPPVDRKRKWEQDDAAYAQYYPLLDPKDIRPPPRYLFINLFPRNKN